MNDPNRKIEIDKSSLLSLKAELLRKQEEVVKAKVTSNVDDFVPRKTPKAERNASEKPKKHQKKNEKKVEPKTTELEDSAQLARSKQMLQMKAKYYERMVASGGALNSDENSLVMFNKKKQDTKPAYALSDESEKEYHSDSSSSSESDTDPDNKWVEYVDCLGRTRKCLKKDLELCLNRDRELAKTMDPREGQRREDMDGSTSLPPVAKAPTAKESPDEEENDEIIGPMPTMAAAEPDVGERFREMREQWAEQEEANLDKDSIHYQDVLFDEARLHGVGYYAFSTDQQERNRQREELDSIRESTMEAQREREALRQARDKIIADRVKAARARQRARQGLPPEEEEQQEEEKQRTTSGAPDQLPDSAEERRLKKIEEKQRKKQEKEERRRERERAQHVRPWDEGKEQNSTDKEWVPAKERFVLSQHEWNDLKRGERIAEFAPPQYDRSQTKPNRSARPGASWAPPQPELRCSESSESSEDDEPAIGPNVPSVAGESKNTSTVTAGSHEDFLPPLEEEPSTRSLFFTTKKNPPKTELKRRNLNVAETTIPTQYQPVLIRNELSDADEPDERTHQREEEARGIGAEIEPPPTYDYYGPSGAKRQPRPATENNANLAASIEAGLKFLRNQCDKAGGPGTKNRWSSNADY